MSREPATTSRPDRPVGRRAGALRLRLVPAAALILLGAGCQSPVDMAQPVGSDPRAARQALAGLAAEGPVPLVVQGNLPGLSTTERDRLVTSAFAQGVRGMDVTFEVTPAEQAAGERLVVILDAGRRGPAGALCDEPRALEEPELGAERVAAAFCRGPEPVAAVEGVVDGPGARPRERLLWRMARALFPDDYEETYGFGVLPEWLGVGVGGSFGF